MKATEFVRDTEIYERVIQKTVPSAVEFLWLATSDLKDLHVAKGRKMVPFLETLSGLVDKGVAIRLIHAKEPGPRFRRDFDKYPNLLDGLERMLCPRTHLKCVVADGDSAYVGSANLTGAGMGAQSPHRRNFEGGIVTTDGGLVGQIMEQFDSIWRGDHCVPCQRKEHCGEYPDVLNRG